MGTGRFFISMVLASALSMGRIFIAAAILDAAPFGIYAVVVATGAFVGVLLSCGLVEASFKDYPRLWNDGRAADVIGHAAKGLVTLTLRGVALLVALVGAAMFIEQLDVSVAVSVAAVGLSVAVTSLYSSVLRATTHVEALGRVTLRRTVVAVLLAVAGALAWGWPGAVLGEVLAGVGAVLLSRRAANALARGVTPKSTPTQDLALKMQSGGLWTFFGFLAAAAPTYLDRPFVASRYGTVVVGSYALLVVFVTAANVFIGIVSQKVGPRLVQMEQQGHTLLAQARYAFRWVGGFWLLWMGGMLVVGMALVWTPLAALAAKYQITPAMWLATAALGCMQMSHLLDFIFLSRDVERLVFLSGAGYLLGTVAACAATYVADVSLTELIWLFSFAKVLQVVCQLFFIARLHSAQRAAEAHA